MPQVSMKALVEGAISGNYIVSFPTDTVPALAVRPDRAELIFAAKRRRPDKPLILMAAKSEDLWPYVAGTPEELELWKQISQQYWPGALTLVLPASAKVPPGVNPTDPTTIGVRVPDFAFARNILEQTGPLATTSANLSGQPPLETVAAIAVQFPEVLTLNSSEFLTLVEMSPSSRIPSTVAKWSGRSWEILRQGSVVISQ